MDIVLQQFFDHISKTFKGITVNDIYYLAVIRCEVEYLQCVPKHNLNLIAVCERNAAYSFSSVSADAKPAFYKGDNNNVYFLSVL